MIHQIGIREANQHLSRYIAAVERGEEVIITRRGRPVARLLPIAKKRQLSAEQKAALRRAGEFWVASLSGSLTTDHDDGRDPLGPIRAPVALLQENLENRACFLSVVHSNTSSFIIDEPVAKNWVSA